MLVLLTQNYMVHQVNVYYVVKTFHPCGHFVVSAALTSVHCARVSELEQPVNAICRPSFVRKFCPQLPRIISLQLT